MFFQWFLAIYLFSDLMLLGYGLVAMLRHGDEVHQVLAIALLWPWLVLRALAKDGLTLLCHTCPGGNAHLPWRIRKCQGVPGDAGVDSPLSKSNRRRRHEHSRKNGVAFA